MHASTGGEVPLNNMSQDEEMDGLSSVQCRLSKKDRNGPTKFQAVYNGNSTTMVASFAPKKPADLLKTTVPLGTLSYLEPTAGSLLTTKRKHLFFSILFLDKGKINSMDKGLYALEKMRPYSRP